MISDIQGLLADNQDPIDFVGAHSDDRRTDHGHPISSPYGSGELKREFNI